MNTTALRKPPRIKRTYNLSQSAVETVKRLADERHLADSQDAVVERAIIELARRVQDAEDAELWAEAARDPEFLAEVHELETGFASDDHRAWQR
jgi:hypothetical protein